MKMLKSINPHDGSVVGETPVSTETDVRQAVENARKALVTWRLRQVRDRVERIRGFRNLLLEHQKELAELMTREMGKPRSQAMDEVIFELDFIDWYFANAEKALDETVIKETEKAQYKIWYEPIGVGAAIAPWNFPVNMASSAIIQQILAGNTIVFKPSEYTTLSQKRFVELLWQAGLPDGVVNLVVGDGEVGKMLVDSSIDFVWFTGSTAVGQEIYEKCGKKFIRGVMELGGSSPGIIFADSNLKNALEQIYIARFFNTGQVCSAVKRLIVERPVYCQVVEALKRKLSEVTVGDPMTDADMGPLVSREQIDLLADQVEDARRKGALVEFGGGRLKGDMYRKGNYFAPTILTNVTPDMRVYREEVFGPVLIVLPFQTEEEAIKLANDTEYGLSAEIYINDKNRAERIAKKIEAGAIGINTDSYYTPFTPIGGMKKSGLGREYGVEGFRELTQIKYLCRAKL